MSKKEAVDCNLTTAKVLINEWGAIREVIEEISTLLKDKQSEDSDTFVEAPVNLLTDQRVNDSIDGPYQTFIKKTLSAYSAINNVRMQVTFTQNENLNIKNVAPAESDLPKEVLKNFNAAMLDKLQHELDTLTRENFKAWQEMIYNWQQNISLGLTMADVALSELEIKELNDLEPLSELEARFADMKLDMPKIAKTGLDFKQYLTMKANLCIHSSLSRQHKEHKPTDISSTLKKIKDTFKQIAQEEKELIQSQNDAINQVISTLP